MSYFFLQDKSLSLILILVNCIHLENLLPVKSNLVNVTKEKKVPKIVNLQIDDFKKNTLHYFYISKTEKIIFIFKNIFFYLI